MYNNYYYYFYDSAYPNRRHGRWHGYGRASFSNGDSYEGEYKFDQRHGRGVYKWHDGRVYDGMFSEDKRHGRVRSCFSFFFLGVPQEKIEKHLRGTSSGERSLLVGFSFAF